MLNYLKEISVGFFVLVVAFSYSIFFIFQAGLGFPAGGNLFQLYSGVLAVISFAVYLYSFNQIPGRANIYSMLICAFVILFYFMTQLFYGQVNNRYNSYFLSMGVRFIPAVLMGVAILRDENILHKIERSLFPFVLLYTLTLASIVFTVKVGVNIGSTFNMESGLNYQNISYYSIFAYGLTLYLIIYANYNQWFNYIVLSLAVMQVLMCIMSGGRGAFVLGLVFTVYFGLKKMSLGKVLVYIVILLCAFFLVQSLLSENQVFAQGFNRIFNFFGNAQAIGRDNRWIRWDLAYNAFLTSPIWGHGLGSVFYEVGFYSHNVFTDLLCEGGVLLAGLFVYILFTFYKRVTLYLKYDHRYEIMIIIFLCSFVMLCFSGYYLSDSGVWLVLSFVLDQSNYHQNIYENESSAVENDFFA